MKQAKITSILVKRAGLSLGVAIALISASVQAAIISFDTPTTFSSASILDVPYVAGYTYVSAMNIGDSAKTFNTPGGTNITFAAGTGAAVLGNVDMPAAASSTTGFYNGGTQWNSGIFAGDTGIVEFNDILDGNAWHNDGSDATRPLTLRLAGLTSGETYAVYLFSVDARAGSAGRDQAYWDGFSSPNFTGNTSGSFTTFTTPSATVVKGIFTADAAYQDVFVQETDGAGNDDTCLNAYTLYTVPVPEPGTFAMLLSGVGVLAMFRRRKG